MTGKVERAPLLKSPTTDHSSPSSLFPPIAVNIGPKGYSNQGQPSFASYYGVVEVTPSESAIQLETRERKLRQPGGIAGSPLVAIIALAVGLVLILSFATTTNIQGQNGKREIILKAPAPSSSPQGLHPPPSHSKPRLSQSAPAESHADIEITQGRLRGYKRLSRQGREYSAFYKVPYAAPPVGSLRFKDPTPPSTWEGLRDIPVVAPQCIQKEKYGVGNVTGGEEDCLYANVYTPRLPPNQPGDEASTDNELMPVMVYVHGGDFTAGNSSRYSPLYFMDEDVVLITFQFRLGAFGFLSTGDDVIRGNMGLKDQVQMLRWVKDNIKHFNGNPELVTIFGNSGGAMAVGHLLNSPMTIGLFHRAISQSGTSLCAPVPDAINQVTVKGTMEEVGKLMDCDTSDSQKYLECLQGKDASELALIKGGNAVFFLTIEDRVGGDESTKFLPEKPFTMLESSGGGHPVPYLVGNVNAEYYTDAIKLLESENETQSLNDHFETYTKIVDANLDAEGMGKVKEFYFGTERIWNGSMKNLGNLISDRKMVHCSYLAARYHAKVADTFLYWMTKPPYLSYMEKDLPGFPAKDMGFVSHADELQYFFHYDQYPEITKDDAEYFEYSKYLVKLWVHFAKTGNAAMDGIDWRTVNELGNGYANSTYWFELNDSPALTIALQERMGFWDQFDLATLRYDW